MSVARQPPPQQSRVLVVSSDPTFRVWCTENPAGACPEVEEASGGADALAKLESAEWEGVLLDSKLDDLDVGEVVRVIQARHPHLAVRVVDKPRGTEGPWQSLGKASPTVPSDFVGAQRAARASEPETVEEDSAPKPLPGMTDTGSGMLDVFRLARLVAPRNTTVLVTGETGTGKELVARGIHQISGRAKGPFVVVNCAAIPEALLEAELFGHARGAFTGAVQSRVGRLHVAHGGTLFLDEVGELPIGMQAKLLRFLQDGEVQRLGSSDVFRVDVRVIAATNVDLFRCVRDGKFRQDLYYRLAVFPLELPPLRRRKDQILPLAELFLNQLCDQANVPRKTIAAPAAALLRQHIWSGNVRELQHAVERAFILTGACRQICAANLALTGAASAVREI